jgi:hypothetical protein
MKAFTVATAKTEIIKRISRTKTASLPGGYRIGDTPDAVIEQAFRELRDEGRIWSRDKRWFLR